MNSYYVYQLRLETSDVPFYIGKGRGRRIHSHMTESSRRKYSHKNNIIEKAIRDGVSVLSEIIHQNLSESEALDMEVSLIAKHGRRIDGGVLCNATLGGEGMSGYKASEETKAKMSESAKKVVKTEEWKAKIGAGRTGIRHTDEAKNAMRLAATGRTHTPEARKKISMAGIGRTHSDETKAKMAEAKIGKQKTAETRAKMSAAARRRIMSDETKAKIAQSSTGRLHTDAAKEKISNALKGRKFSENQSKLLRFSRWDKNPIWKDASRFYDFWLSNGKPSVTKMKRLLPESSVAQITTNFKKGWIPANDPSWIKYRDSKA